MTILELKKKLLKKEITMLQYLKGVRNVIDFKED